MIKLESIRETSLFKIFNRRPESNSTRRKRDHYKLAQNVKVKGLELSSRYSQDVYKFEIYAENLGVGRVNVSFSGPGSVQVEQNRKKSCLQVKYSVDHPGTYSVDLKYLNFSVPGSPFKVQMENQECKPKAVVTTGKGLMKVKQGSKAEFVVNTSKAGPGTLCIFVDGPKKVPVYYESMKDGYKIIYYPSTPGDYFIRVKYNGAHVSGSPFRAVCTDKYFPLKLIPLNSLDDDYRAGFRKRWSRMSI